VPSGVPTVLPSHIPSTLPSNLPSGVPSSIPSTVPSNAPSSKCAIIDVISNNVEEFRIKLCEAVEEAVGSSFSSCDVKVDDDCVITLTFVEQLRSRNRFLRQVGEKTPTVDTSNQVVIFNTQDFVVKVFSEVTSEVFDLTIEVEVISIGIPTDYNLVVMKLT